MKNEEGSRTENTKLMSRATMRITDSTVQSLLKVAIHGGGGTTRPDLGRAVQFEGHWIARLNPGRQRAGGAAGAGAE